MIPHSTNGPLIGLPAICNLWHGPSFPFHVPYFSFHNPHLPLTLYMQRLTLHTLHSTLQTLLYTPPLLLHNPLHSTGYTLHSTLQTLHPPTPHSTIYSGTASCQNGAITCSEEPKSASGNVHFGFVGWIKFS